MRRHHTELPALDEATRNKIVALRRDYRLTYGALADRFARDRDHIREVCVAAGLGGDLRIRNRDTEAADAK